MSGYDAEQLMMTPIQKVIATRNKAAKHRDKRRVTSRTRSLPVARI